MTLHAPLWQQNAAGYTAQADRRIIDILRTVGVCATTDLAVTPRAAGPNRSVDVAPGSAVIAGTDIASQGHYLVTSDDAVNVPLAEAPPSGQSRIDLIVASVADSAAIGMGPDNWTLTAVTGAPGVVPTPPSAPPSSVILAQVLVPGLATTITAGLIADKRRLSGDPATGLSAPPSMPPSFDGQIVSGVANVYAAYGGVWWPLRQVINPAKMASNRPSNGSTSSTATFATWGTASISDVTWSTVMTAELTGHFSGGAGSVVVDISYDGGGTWLSSPERFFTSANSLDFNSISLTVATAGTPSGSVQARGRFKSLAGSTIAAGNGYLLLTAIPGN